VKEQKRTFVPTILRHLIKLAFESLGLINCCFFLRN